jgi:hypothetical protein
MPKFARHGPQGALPPKLDLYNVYPEQAFYIGGICVRLRCKETVTLVESPSEYVLVDWSDAHRRVSPIPWPYFLETEVPAEDAREALDKAMGHMESITDWLTFLLNFSIRIVMIEASAPSVSEAGKFDYLVTSLGEYHSISGQTTFLYYEPAYTDFNSCRIKPIPSPRDRQAIMWFGRGVRAEDGLEKFLSYWIGFEILVSQFKDAGASRPSSFHEAARIAGAKLGRERELIDRLWKIRQMVHGRLPRNEELAPMIPEMKALLADAIKIRLGIPFSEPPQIPIKSVSVSPTFWMHGTTEERLDCVEGSS